MAWNGFDIAVTTLVILIGLKGFINGFIREFAGLVGLVTGLWTASRFGASVGEWIGSRFLSIDSPSALHFLGFLSTVTLIWLLSVLLGAFIARLAPSEKFPKSDRLLGFLFASLKVFIILAVLLTFLSSIEFVRKNGQKFVSESRLYPLLLKTGNALLPVEAYEDDKKKTFTESNLSFQKNDGEGNRTQKAD